MLSKPKYMLPGNLSQGAPILEPDENGDYKFSFALDGDEKIEDIELNIYTDIDHTVKKFESSTISLITLGEEEKSIFSTIDDSKLTDFKFQTMDGGKISLEFTIPYTDEFEIRFLNKEDEFLINEGEEVSLNYTVSFEENYEINYKPEGSSSKSEMTLWKEHSRSDEGYEVDNLFIIPLQGMRESGNDVFSVYAFALRQKSSRTFLANETIQLTASRSEERLKYYGRFKEGKIKFCSSELVYSSSSLHSSLPLEETVFVPVKELSKGLSMSPGRSFTTLGLPYAIETNSRSDDGCFFATLILEEDKLPHDYFYSENQRSNYDIVDYWKKDSALVSRVDGFIFNLKNFFRLEFKECIKGEIKNRQIPLDSEKILIKKDTSIENYNYPKDYKGNYNFFTLLLNAEQFHKLQQDFLLNWNNFFWGVKINKKIISDNIFFQTRKRGNQYSFYKDIKTNRFGVVVNTIAEYIVESDDTLSTIASKYNVTLDEILAINPDITNPNLINIGQKIKIKVKEFIDYDIIEYQYEIKNKKGIVYYKSPLIKSSNMQFAQLSLPPSIQDDNGGYSLYFTALNKDMRTIQLTEELPFSVLNSEFDATYNYNILTKEINIQLEENGWETNYLQNYTLMCCDETKENYRIVKENISFEEIRNFSYYDTFNPYQKFYYFLVPVIKTWPTAMGDPYPQHSNFFYFENLPVDKWRLILTKEKKSDIIYSVDKVYDFYYNLVSGSIGNNAETILNTNFTSMPSVQKGFSNYWSGSLSALMGICDEQGEFVQTIEQEKALEQLVLDQEHDKFLLDREGNIWQVEISAPLTIANQDGLIQVDKLIDLKTITINWVQVGSPTQIIFNFEE